MVWLFGRTQKMPPDDDGPPPLSRPDDFVVLIDPDVDPRLVVYHDPHGFQAEQYRAFRTNLRAMNPEDESRTLLFTSSLPEEGKTVSVANIALSLAEREELQVCVIDTDLRASRMHELFGLERDPGFVEVLSDRVNPADALQSTRLPNLKLMSAGREVLNPAEVIGSDHTQNLIAWLKQRFHYILFDTPPCSMFADAAELSRVMDGVVMVVALGETPKRDVDRAIGQLTAVGANVVGSFVTGTDSGDAVKVVEDRQYAY